MFNFSNIPPTVPIIFGVPQYAFYLLAKNNCLVYWIKSGAQHVIKQKRCQSAKTIDVSLAYTVFQFNILYSLQVLLVVP